MPYSLVYKSIQQRPDLYLVQVCSPSQRIKACMLKKHNRKQAHAYVSKQHAQVLIRSPLEARSHDAYVVGYVFITPKT